eukprot:3299-Heterococcus_DN1.PRE.2
MVDYTKPSHGTHATGNTSLMNVPGRSYPETTNTSLTNVVSGRTTGSSTRSLNNNNAGGLFSGGVRSAADDLEIAKRNSSAYVQSGLCNFAPSRTVDRISSDAADAGRNAIDSAQRAAEDAVNEGKRLGHEGADAAKRATNQNRYR